MGGVCKSAPWIWGHGVTIAVYQGADASANNPVSHDTSPLAQTHCPSSFLTSSSVSPSHWGRKSPSHCPLFQLFTHPHLLWCVTSRCCIHNTHTHLSMFLIYQTSKVSFIPYFAHIYSVHGWKFSVRKISVFQKLPRIVPEIPANSGEAGNSLCFAKCKMLCHAPFSAICERFHWVPITLLYIVCLLRV